MKNYKVGKKLAISYITIMFLLILGSIVNIRNLIEVGERVESFYDGPFNVGALLIPSVLISNHSRNRCCGPLQMRTARLSGTPF